MKNIFVGYAFYETFICAADHPFLQHLIPRCKVPHFMFQYCFVGVKMSISCEHVLQESRHTDPS